jgi:Cu/Ag efflux protein CusF
MAARERAGTARPSTANHWPAQGVVRAVAPEMNRIFIEHGDIPGLMEAMTMAFEPADPNLLNGLVAGDRVQFTLQKQGDRLTVIAIQKGASP